MMTFEDADKIIAEKLGWKVYRYTFPNGKVYIGKTCKKMSERQHTKDWEGYKNCPKVYAAIKKYGVKNIVTNILFFGFMDEKEASKREREMIALHKSNQREYGYNLTEGGDGTTGYKASLETRNKISKGNKGKKRSLEQRKRISESKKGKPSSKKGIKLSTEARKNISKGLKGHIAANRKCVFCVELEKNYSSIESAAKSICKAHGTITHALKTGKTAGGYHWKYVEEE